MDAQQSENSPQDPGGGMLGDPPAVSVSITPVGAAEEVSPRVVGGGSHQTTVISEAPITFEQPDPPPSGFPDPSRMVARYLFDSEIYRGEWRRHWIHIAKWVVLAALSPLLVGYLVGLAGERTILIIAIVGGWVALFALVGYKLLDWFFDRFVLTDKRVMVIAGIITRRVGMMPLARVTDMAYLQSPLGRVLNYGTFVLESAGQDQALREIKPLPEPIKLYLLFCQQMYDPTKTPAPKKED